MTIGLSTVTVGVPAPKVMAPLRARLFEATPPMMRLLEARVIGLNTVVPTPMSLRPEATESVPIPRGPAALTPALN